MVDVASHSMERPRPPGWVSTLAMVRRRWWLVAITGLLCGVIACGVSLTRAPVYESSVSLYVTSGQDPDSQSAYQGLLASQQRVASYARLASSEAVISKALSRSGLSIDDESAKRRVSAAPSLNTVMLSVSAKGPSPAEAAVLANSVSESLVDYVAQIEVPAGGGNALAKLSIVSPASVNDAPVSPKFWRNVSIGLFAGVLLGLVLAIGRGLYDTKIRTESDLRDLVSIPVLASIPAVPDSEKAGAVQRSGNAAEAFRKLRTSLDFLSVDRTARVFLVTSPHLGDGKTSVVADLAVAFAEAGHRTVVLDADLRRPALAKRFGCTGDIGVSDVLRGAAQVDEVVQRSGIENLSVVASGTVPPNPAELVGSSRAREMVRELRSSYEYVLVDAPPVVPVTDAVVMANEVDGVVVVVRSGRTRSRDLSQLLREMGKTPARVDGLVLNAVPWSDAGYYQDRYVYSNG